MKAKELWRFKYNESILGIELGDINYNGQTEIIAYTKTGILLIFSLDGKLLHEKEISKNKSIWQAIIYDINKDGKQEIILGGMDGVLRVFKSDLAYNLNLIWSHKFEASISGILIDDINNDGFNDLIVFSLDKTIRVLNPLDGSLIWAQIFMDGVGDAILWTDIKGSKNKELIACGNDGTIRAFNGKSGDLIWFRQYSEKIRCNSFMKSKIGDLIICGGDDKLLHFIDKNSHEEIKSVKFDDYVWKTISFPKNIYNKLLVSTYSFKYFDNSIPIEKINFTSKILYLNENLEVKWELKNKNIETITIFTRNKKNFILLGTTLGELIILDENTGKILINIKKKSCLNSIKVDPSLNVVIACHDIGTLFTYLLEDY
ncbi:MAG: hypothetical protein ACFFA6_13240 [Promethearchaeota archaeon]